MLSLQEQLLKAGLANEKSAKKIRKEKKKTNKAVRKKQQAADTTLQDEIKAQKAQQVEKDLALNKAIQQDLDQKSAQGKARQMIEQLQLTDIAGEVEFNYVREGKVKTILVDQVNYNALTKGRTGICLLNDKVYVLPAQAVDKIQAVDTSYVLLLNDNQVAEIDEDDPYADFQIPDDLMW